MATAAVAICYEIVHSATLRALMAGGAQLLLNPTSDLWQDSDLAARQQKAIAAARAAELGIYVFRVSNRYHSSVFSPTGAEVFTSGPIDEERIFVLSIAPSAPQTLRGKSPLVMELLLVGLSLAAVLVCIVLARRNGARQLGSRVQPRAHDSVLPYPTNGSIGSPCEPP